MRTPSSSGKPAVKAADAVTSGACQNESVGYSTGTRRCRFMVTISTVVVSILATQPAGLVSALVSQASTTTTFRHASMVSPHRTNKRKNWHRLNVSKKNLSSSDRERRDEDRRRKERKDDVVIGKTSAKKDAVDYAIDPEATEREYLRQASREERLIHQYTNDGMHAIRDLRLDLADESFDKVFELRPEAYLWQAGIVKFYLDDWKAAAEIFARSAVQFERKFGPMGMGPATEERIWRSAAELKYFHSLKRSQRKEYLLRKQEKGVLPIAQLEDEDGETDEYVKGGETRKVLRLTRELFDASTDHDKALEAIARAKLLSFVENNPNQKKGGKSIFSSPDVKKRKLHACYFLALHYDVVGEIEESKRWIKTAYKLCTNAGKTSDIMDSLPLLHLTTRDWFDDDPYDENDLDFHSGAGDSESDSDGGNTRQILFQDESGGSEQHMSDAYSDPVLEASIMEDLNKMKFEDIRNALRIRGVSVTGSKETLKERLFISLMDDAGYQSGFAP